jgi:hypothetical protein
MNSTGISRLYHSRYPHTRFVWGKLPGWLSPTFGELVLGTNPPALLPSFPAR